MIATLFRLPNYLQEEKMEFVRFKEEDAFVQALLSSIGNDNRIYFRFRAAPCKVLHSDREGWRNSRAIGASKAIGDPGSETSGGAQYCQKPR